MVFDPNTIQLVLGEPERRRRFLNWGLFHVKPQFSEEWRACARAWHQRNQLLKLGRSNDALSDWTRVLAAHSEVIDSYREAYYQQLRLEFLRLTQLLGRFDGLKLEYRRGWPSEMSLAEALQADLATDLRRGFSQKGLHRSDLRLSVGGRSVIEHYSRGEAKMLAWALSLAQLSCLPDVVRQKTILLVDDPVAEIDGDHGQLISGCLTENNPQIFTTCTDPEALTQFWGHKLNRLFHVKQGIIRDTGGDHYE
jgi:DNA replication and repair protein RecF